MLWVKPVFMMQVWSAYALMSKQRSPVIWPVSLVRRPLQDGTLQIVARGVKKDADLDRTEPIYGE